MMHPIDMDSYWFKSETRAKRGFGKKRLELIEQLTQEEIALELAIIEFVAGKDPEVDRQRSIVKAGIDALVIKLLEITITKDTSHISRLGPISDAIREVAAGKHKTKRDIWIEDTQMYQRIAQSPVSSAEELGDDFDRLKEEKTLAKKALANLASSVRMRAKRMCKSDDCN